ncbi:MAG: PfkB protein [Patescibacteria group bacterium]|nr:PfkB protein [Patescibacteria group bacterium]
MNELATPKIMACMSMAVEIYLDQKEVENPNVNYSKKPLDDHQITMGGSTPNIVNGLQKQGYPSTLIGFTGPGGKDDPALNLLNSIEIPGLTITAVPCLGKTSLSTILRGDPHNKNFDEHLYEYKGTIIQEKFLEYRENLKKSCDGFDWKIASGVKNSNPEMLFLTDNFGDDSNNFLIPKMDLVKDVEFRSIVPIMDVIPMNLAEYQSGNLKIEDYHELGVSLIIITDSGNGGSYSFRGTSGTYDAYLCGYTKIYETGAGDWFVASVIVSLINQGIVKIKDATFENIKTAIEYAARIAGIKVGIKGASNGPSHD